MTPSEELIDGFFERNKEYKRSEIHAKYGGQEQGGISTPSSNRFILLFTGEGGKEYGYSDGLNDAGVFFYTGEGQVGDMSFVRGNLAIRDHQINGKELLLFRSTRIGYVRFLDHMVSIGNHIEKRPDINDQLRDAIIFELLPVDNLAATGTEPEIEQTIVDLSLDELRDKALASSNPAATLKERKTLVFQRSIAIKIYALKRANGICEGCDTPAPFVNKNRDPFLEVHHIKKLSDGGPDHPESVAALCPNCHRKAHHSFDAEAFNNSLAQKVLEKETRHS